nr:SpoVA/SpoVAEb family sporulation membrane protein [uncultured Ruminococcus sp.]
MTNERYARLVKKRSQNSDAKRDCLKAFLIGGLICMIGQAILEIYGSLGFDKKTSATLCSVTLIGAGVLLTALHRYERIAKHGGAGTLVPITGFANAMSSPAIEFRTEGLITGLAAKMFVIAGPVLVYGTAAAVVYGAIYWAVSHITG